MRAEHSVRVQRLRCGHVGLLTAKMLSRKAITPSTPIAAFVKRLRCRRCGSQSVLATRSPADRRKGPPDATRYVPGWCAVRQSRRTLFPEYAAINRKRANEQNRAEPVPPTNDVRTLMDDADLLRKRATRLFALAARSRQAGNSEYAEELDSLARDVVKHAVAIERRFRVAAA